jgi:hypothetical protein
VIGGVLRFIIFRVFGARVLLVLAVLGWLRNRIWPPARPVTDTTRGEPRRRASSGGDRR